MLFSRPRLPILAAIFCLSLSFFPVSARHNLAYGQAVAVEPNLTEDQMRQFLLTAKVIKSKATSKGITSPYRLTLSDGQLTHDAAFQSIDSIQNPARFPDGTIEYNFRDTYHFNIAAYGLAKLLGLEHMMPVTVERFWGGNKGSLTWWLKTKMDEVERIQQKIAPPDPESWNRQMHRQKVFGQLVCDSDRNLSNILIGENWEIYMIDFSRAFRRHNDLPNPKELVRCDRQLLQKLRQLDQTEIQNKTKGHLNKEEVKTLMERRDKIVALFDQLVAQQGEDQVLY